MCLNNRPLKLLNKQNNRSNEAWTRYIKYFYFTIIWVLSVTQKKLNIFFIFFLHHFKNKISSFNKGSTKIRHAMIYFRKVKLKFHHFVFNCLKSYFRFQRLRHLFEIEALVTQKQLFGPYLDKMFDTFSNTIPLSYKAFLFEWSIS